MRNWYWILLFSLTFSGCAYFKKDVLTGGVYRLNLDPERLVDLNIAEKLTGKKKMWLFKDKAIYLEGYIRGEVVDYNDTPLEGIVVRVMERGKDTPGFDPAVTDSNGIYKIRFSLPIKKKKVDIKGTIAYNPPWEQQLDILGATLEPQTKATSFRLYYDKKLGIIGIGEDMPKSISRKITEAEKMEEDAIEKEKRLKKRRISKPAPIRPKRTVEEDPFGGFGDFGN